MILGVLLLASCSSPQQEEAWMLEQLYEDNWRYLARDPQQLSLKFQSMNDSYYAFMRGTLSLYVGTSTAIVVKSCIHPCSNPR